MKGRDLRHERTDLNRGGSLMVESRHVKVMAGLFRGVLAAEVNQYYTVRHLFRSRPLHLPPLVNAAVNVDDNFFLWYRWQLTQCCRVLLFSLP